MAEIEGLVGGVCVSEGDGPRWSLCARNSGFTAAQAPGN